MWCRISGSIRPLPSWKRLPGRKKTRWNSSATSAAGRAAGTASAVMRWSAARTLGKTARITAVPRPTRRRGTAFPKPCGARRSSGWRISRKPICPWAFPISRSRGGAWAARWCWNFCSTTSPNPNTSCVWIGNRGRLSPKGEHQEGNQDGIYTGRGKPLFLQKLQWP